MPFWASFLLVTSLLVKVSNPYRYSTNSSITTILTDFVLVSNPYRYSTNATEIKNYIGGTNEFQTLIGILQTSVCRRLPLLSKVSNPYRYSTNSFNSTSTALTVSVSNPYRYSTNGERCKYNGNNWKVSNPYRYSTNPRISPVVVSVILSFKPL